MGCRGACQTLTSILLLFGNGKRIFYHPLQHPSHQLSRVPVLGKGWMGNQAGASHKRMSSGV